jgi:DNA-binding Xre family transcriptional regulator
MTEEFTTLVFQTLLGRSKNGKLGKKDTTDVAEQFGISLRSTKKLWKRGKIHLGQGIPVNVASRKRGRVGRKKIQADLEHLRNVPLKDRMTLEDISEVLGISKSTLHRYLQQGLLRCHSNTIKPHLTNDNKMSRL